MEKSEILQRFQAATTFTNLLEVFVDDFCALTNNTSTEHLTNFSRAMLHGIHSVFPPPEVSGHHGEDPVAKKKMDAGDGTWDTIKEILGWIMDGANFTMQLPPTKCGKIAALIGAMVRKKGVTLNEFQKVAGKLQHASFGVPGGKGLFSPIWRVLQGNPPWVKMTKTLRSTLKDWRTLIRAMARDPSQIPLLIPKDPDFIHHTDACKLGAGGVIRSGNRTIKPIVWQFRWPQEIQEMLITAENPNGKLTINDLELAGIVLGWLIMEMAEKDLDFSHVGMFCDNTSATAWANKGHSTKSLAAARLLRFLALRQRTRRVSSLTTVHIAGS